MSLRTGLAFVLAAMALPCAVLAAPCASEDFETKISGQSECLIMRRYGPLEAAAMVVWLHGNVSTGGPANSHFRLAQKAATDFAAENLLSVALVRQGYPDGTGAYSSGSDNGRADNWRRIEVAEIASVIARLRSRFAAKTVIVAGHSGGAAIASVLLGMKPELAQAAILIGCPCDMTAWRAGRNRTPWSSEDPMDWTEKLDPATRVIALTGSLDSTTAPHLARDYVARLNARHLSAEFRLVAAAGHIDILGSPAIMEALSDLLRRP